jgi:hypothetical protein
LPFVSPKFKKGVYNANGRATGARFFKAEFVPALDYEQINNPSLDGLAFAS